jgi:hypothetical protein
VSFFLQLGCRLKDYSVALTWLSWLRLRHGNDDNLSLLSTTGRLQLIMGHTQAAAASFQVCRR